VKVSIAISKQMIWMPTADSIARAGARRAASIAAKNSAANAAVQVVAALAAQVAVPEVEVEGSQASSSPSSRRQPVA
jgi:hypothetical protein